jgi:F-type H+-transporting ATPase subunit delta
MAEKATVARPYARAAFAHAKDKGQLGEWSAWLRRTRETVTSDEYLQLRRSPGVRTGQLIDVLTAAAGPSLDAHGRALIDLLAEYGRLDHLPEIATLFEALVAEDQNVADVKVVSAVALEDRQKERLVAALRGRLKREVRLHCTTDASLIGGAIVRSGDLLIDGSLKGKLGRLETELTG